MWRRQKEEVPRTWLFLCNVSFGNSTSIIASINLSCSIVDRTSAIMVTELSSVMGIIIQYSKENIHSVYSRWVYVAQNCMLWHISPQRADVFIFWGKELLTVPSLMLTHYSLLYCAYFSWIWFIRFTWIVPITFLSLHKEKNASSAMQCSLEISW